MSTVTIHLFGGFHLTYNGASITIHQARQQSLLAYLLLYHHTPQARQHLAFLFWPDSSETQAHNNLRKVLHHLRQTLPEADRLLQITGTTVQWQPAGPFVLDVAEFEQTLVEATQAEQTGDLVNLRTALTHAADLYTGELLPGCYEEWILPERERLREEFLSAVARLSELLEQQRDYGAAIHATQRLLRADPLHEESYHRLMRLHALNGDRAGALRSYHTSATVLKRELGVEPNQRLQELYRQLLNLESIPAPPSTHPGVRNALVGRHSE